MTLHGRKKRQRRGRRVALRCVEDAKRDVATTTKRRQVSVQEFHGLARSRTRRGRSGCRNRCQILSCHCSEFAVRGQANERADGRLGLADGAFGSGQLAVYKRQARFTTIEQCQKSLSTLAGISCACLCTSVAHVPVRNTHYVGARVDNTRHDVTRRETSDPKRATFPTTEIMFVLTAKRELLPWKSDSPVTQRDARGDT